MNQERVGVLLRLGLDGCEYGLYQCFAYILGFLSSIADLLSRSQITGRATFVFQAYQLFPISELLRPASTIYTSLFNWVRSVIAHILFFCSLPVSPLMSLVLRVCLFVCHAFSLPHPLFVLLSRAKDCGLLPCFGCRTHECHIVVTFAVLMVLITCAVPADWWY